MVPGLEPTSEMDLEVTRIEADPGLERVEQTDIEFIGEPLEGMESAGGTSIDEALLDAPDDDLLVSVPASRSRRRSGGETGRARVRGAGGRRSRGGRHGAGTPLADLPLLPDGPPAEAGRAGDRILDDPDNPELHLQLAERLIAGGEEVRGLEELELALGGYERIGDWPRAAELAERLTVLAPDTIRHHQKRVELAFRSGDRTPLLAAYLALGDALARAGATEKAMAVFGRVQEHDPGNVHAVSALAALRGEPAASRGAAPAEPAAPARPAAPATEAPSPPPPRRRPERGRRTPSWISDP